MNQKICIEELEIETFIYTNLFFNDSQNKKKSITIKLTVSLEMLKLKRLAEEGGIIGLIIKSQNCRIQFMSKATLQIFCAPAQDPESLFPPLRDFFSTEE